uniref:Uncharacterized protein n=1 Tax=Branchiostoma floridae TaxID=7739 RepID=C3YJR3_BRAFL|eukprot:XP_002603359.1 hypothetical protein BRAFLDRAFT_80352 [Branchiostoma floridae]
MVLVHTSPPHPSGSQQNCFRPDMPYKTGHAEWSGLDLGSSSGRASLSLPGCMRNEETTSTEEANKCPRDVSDETHTAVGPVKMRDKALSTAEDVRTASTEIKKTSGDV